MIASFCAVLRRSHVQVGAITLLVLLWAQGAVAAGVAWQDAATDGDIARAFARAKGEAKPVLLYWGAKWCPPCNRLKATLFNRGDFIELSQSFVPVHVDGDGPGAQKLGARFKVRGYPTMIIFGSDGREVTRLPGEAEAPQVLAVMRLGLASGRTAKAVLADAQAGKPIGANDWRVLAFYGWDIDEEQLAPAAGRARLLAQLAATGSKTDEEAGARLLLRALAGGENDRSYVPDAAAAQRVRDLLSRPEHVRKHADLLGNSADDMVRALAPHPGPERESWAALFDRALRQLAADSSLSRADRAQCLLARIEIARIDVPKSAVQPGLAAPLQNEVRTAARRYDREVNDVYERQVVITTAAYALARAGLWAESDTLLKTAMAKSHSPYYLMSMLGANAKALGRKDEALRWYEQAFTRSEGPATRLQWGASYLAALVELAPQDAKQIERVAAQLFSEASRDHGAFHERSARALHRVGTQLANWSADGRNNDVLLRLRERLDAVCAGLQHPEKPVCENVMGRRG